MSEPRTFKIKISTTAPTGSATTTLLDTTTAFGTGVFRTLGVKRISFQVNNDQVGTLVAKRSIDNGAVWTTYSSMSITIPPTSQITGPIDYGVDFADDIQILWTNGGSNQTTWTPEMHGHLDRMRAD